MRLRVIGVSALLVIHVALASSDNCHVKFKWYQRLGAWTQSKIVPEGTLNLSQRKFDEAVTLYSSMGRNSNWMRENPPRTPEEKLAFAEVMNNWAGNGSFAARDLSELNVLSRRKLAVALNGANFVDGVSLESYQKAYEAAWNVLNPRVSLPQEGNFFRRYQLRHADWAAQQRNARRAVGNLDDSLVAMGFDRTPGFAEALRAFKRRHPKVAAMGSFAVVSAVLYLADYAADRDATDASKMIEATSQMVEESNPDTYMDDFFSDFDPNDPLVQKLKAADKKFSESLVQ